MAASRGRQALLIRDLCLNPTQPGLGEPAGSTNKPFTLILKTSHLPPITSLASPLLPSFSKGGGDDTNKSFKVSLFFSGSGARIAGWRWTGGGSCRGGDKRPEPELRVSSMRRVVFLRRRWTRGLVLGLRVGLCATPHCVASSLNFCNVAILSGSSPSLSLTHRVVSLEYNWVWN